MEKKNIERIMKMAQNKEFKDAEYCNDIVSGLCEELIKRISDNAVLKEQVENPPLIYPHQCFVINTGDGLMVFTERYEAEMFKAIVKNDGLVRSVEFFNDHRKAAFKYQQGFLLAK